MSGGNRQQGEVEETKGDNRCTHSMGSLGMQDFLRPQRRTSLLFGITPRGSFNIRKRVGNHRVRFRVLKVTVRAELNGLLRGRVGRGVVLPEYTLAETVLKPHQRRDNGHDLGHRASELRGRKKRRHKAMTGRRET